MSELDLATLFESEKARLYGLALRLTGNHDEAEDALQETWLAALKGLAWFRGDAKPSTWLYRIALRKALATRARRGRRPVELDLEPQAAKGSDPVEARESLQHLLRALDTLSTDHRVVLSLATVQDLPTKEIAEVLAIPEGTVWSRLSKARAALLEAVGSSRGQDSC